MACAREVRARGSAVGQDFCSGHGAEALMLVLVCLLFETLVAHSGFCFLLFASCCAGIRDFLSCFMRCPCAGRHLLFFAAAKKSRQKKAAFVPPVPARIAPRHAAAEPSRSDV